MRGWPFCEAFQGRLGISRIIHFNCVHRSITMAGPADTPRCGAQSRAFGLRERCVRREDRRTIVMRTILLATAAVLTLVGGKAFAERAAVEQHIQMAATGGGNHPE